MNSWRVRPSGRSPEGTCWPRDWPSTAHGSSLHWPRSRLAGEVDGHLQRAGECIANCAPGSDDFAPAERYGFQRAIQFV